jgi:hypothetical protein
MKKNSTNITADMLAKDDGRGIHLKPEIVRTRQNKSKRAVTVPIIGTVGPDGIKLFREESVTATLPNGEEVELYGDAAENDEETAKRYAKAVSTFLEGGMPDFLLTAVIEALDFAREYHDQRPLVMEDYDADNLWPLFMKTKFTRWSDISQEPDADKIVRAMSELLHNPETPQGLFCAVAEFVTEQSNVDAEKIFHSDPVLAMILESVPPDELRSAILNAAGGVQ